MTLFELLANSAAAEPEALALTFHQQTMTYRELLASVEGFAGGLASLKIGKRARIAVLLPNCPAFVIAYLGASRAGATVVPVNILYRPDEARYMLADAQAEVLITAESFRPLAQALRPLLPELKHLVMVSEGDILEDEVDFRRLCHHPPAPRGALSKRDIAVILYTSGTTGRPKGAMLTHRNLIANARSCSQALAVYPTDCFLSALPLFHAFAALVCLVLPISIGAHIVLMERFVPAHTLELLAETRTTVFAGVPSMFGLMLQLPPAIRPELPALRTCLSGGAPMPPEVWTAFEEMFEVTLAEGYGLTEASPVVTVNPPLGIRKKGSIGPPVPGVQIKILNNEGRAVGQGVIGELVVRGENVMKGYLNKPAETEQVLRRGWLYTGDLVRADEDGYLYIVGRKKELIIVGGLNVYPGEVERVLVEHPAVLEAAAFGVPDTTRGEAVWAAVVLRPGVSATDRELQAHCREKLASYKVPRKILLRDELPKNALGKVQRHLLYEQHDAGEIPHAKTGSTSSRQAQRRKE